MSLFPLPFVSDVIDDASLISTQVNASYRTDDLRNDVEEKIVEASQVIESRILAITAPQPWPFGESRLALAMPKYTPAQRAQSEARWGGIAQIATKWLAIAYLYERSGQLSRAYPEEAARYEAKAERLLTGSDDGSGKMGLLGTLGGLADDITSGDVAGGLTGGVLTFIPALDDSIRRDEFGRDLYARNYGS